MEMEPTPFSHKGDRTARHLALDQRTGFDIELGAILAISGMKVRGDMVPVTLR